MNLFEELVYKPWVSTAFYPLPVEYWAFFNEALATFPTIESLSNFTQSPRRKKIEIIILHHSGSLEIAKALKWFSNPNTYSSTNYLIDRDGYTLCLVPEDRAALHTPNATFNHSRLVNELSIGCTLVGDGFSPFSETQYEALAMLCVIWKKKYGLKNEDIWRHADIEHTGERHIDPSPFNREKLLALIDLFEKV
jgi:N-acetyl-anhydromuramyl-L-alanine amidase AmpD